MGMIASRKLSWLAVLVPVAVLSLAWEVSAAPLFQRYALATYPGMARVLPRGCGWTGGGIAGVWVENRAGRSFRVGFHAGKLRLTPLQECPEPIVPEDAERLPDGEVSLGRGAIAAAWLAEPTTRYGHGILGDAIEAGALRVMTRSGKRLSYRLGEESVFEDRRARIVDLEDDGRPELLVLQTGLRSGGALALFNLREGALRPLASSEPFGLPYRWLNVAGVADFDGDGRKEIAVVLTPHIGGTLALYERKGRRLVRDHSEYGFSNHAIGSRELGMSAVLDANGDGVPDLAVPGTERVLLRIVTFAGGTFRELAVVDNAKEIAGAIAPADLDGNGNTDLVFALKDGTLVALLR